MTVTYVSENVPQIEKLVNDLNVQKNTVQELQDRVIANITELKEKIKLARDEANRVGRAVPTKANIIDFFKHSNNKIV